VPQAIAGWQAPMRSQDSNKQVTRMIREFNGVIERDSEGYYVASVPSLPGCHTQAKSLATLMERIRESIELCLEVEHGDTEPLDFVGIQKIMIAA
jgi:predicted RNase H-like HicB family nuclease